MMQEAGVEGTLRSLITRILFRATMILIGWHNESVKEPDDMLYVERMSSHWNSLEWREYGTKEF
jgi:hypothetical protein